MGLLTSISCSYIILYYILRMSMLHAYYYTPTKCEVIPTH